MRDQVYRQAAIDAVCKAGCGSGYCGIPCDEVNALRGLPSAEPERESAEWVKNDNGTYSCSKCQSWIPKEQRHYARFCLHCGSKMGRRTDETD